MKAWLRTKLPGNFIVLQICMDCETKAAGRQNRLYSHTLGSSRIETIELEHVRADEEPRQNEGLGNSQFSGCVCVCVSLSLSLSRLRFGRCPCFPDLQLARVFVIQLSDLRTSETLTVRSTEMATSTVAGASAPHVAAPLPNAQTTDVFC